jgi:hypothetical protein
VRKARADQYLDSIAAGDDDVSVRTRVTCVPPTLRRRKMTFRHK